MFTAVSSAQALDALMKKKDGTQYRAITSGSGGEEFVQKLRRERIMCKVLVFCMSVSYHKTWARNYGNVEVTNSSENIKKFATWND